LPESGDFKNSAVRTDKPFAALRLVVLAIAVSIFTETDYGFKLGDLEKFGETAKAVFSGNGQ
jgi:hypothetical protein